jgi:hypothetical protein
MLAILGIAMLYSWIHGGVIVYNKIGKTTGYEQAVLIFAAVAWALEVWAILVS